MQTPPYIKELSIVGLPDGIGEKVACLVAADDEYDISLPRAALHRLLKSISAKSPLPALLQTREGFAFHRHRTARTATRKVKRREVVQIMESLEESQKSATWRRAGDGECGFAVVGRVSRNVANRPRSEVSIDRD